MKFWRKFFVTMVVYCTAMFGLAYMMFGKHETAKKPIAMKVEQTK